MIFTNILEKLGYYFILNTQNMLFALDLLL